MIFFFFFFTAATRNWLTALVCLTPLGPQAPLWGHICHKSKVVLSQTAAPLPPFGPRGTHISVLGRRDPQKRLWVRLGPFEPGNVGFPHLWSERGHGLWVGVIPGPRDLLILVPSNQSRCREELFQAEPRIPHAALFWVKWLPRSEPHL